MDGAGKRRMVAPPGAGDLDHHQRVVGKGSIGPGEMRRARAFAHRHQRADGGVIAAETRHAHRLRVIDRGDHLVLRHAGLHRLDRPVHGMGADAAGFAHQLHLRSRISPGAPSSRDRRCWRSAPPADPSSDAHGSAPYNSARPSRRRCGALPQPRAADQRGELIVGMIDGVLHERLGEGNDIALRAGRW